jgi:hypothetical protein
MAHARDEWNVLPHDPLEPLAENLWHTTGALPGMSLRRAMTVARMRDGGLVIHSAIAMDDASMRILEAAGTPAFLLVPNAFHRLDAPRFKRRYPGLRVFCPPAGRAKIHPVVPVDGTYDEFPGDDSVRLTTLRGTAGREGAMIVRSADGATVVLNDIVFNMDAKKDVLGWLFTTALGSAPGPRISRLSRLALVKDRTTLEGELSAFATDDLVRLVVSHEKVARGADAGAALRQALTFL